MTDLAAVLSRLTADRPAAHARLMEFLRIPSVSAQPAHAADCRRAAEWAAAHLTASGFTASLRETAGHPVVVAHHAGPPASAGTVVPHILYYGHYDVQPAEPLALWTSPAFEPVVVQGRHGPRIVARGAVDDKGQVSMWLEALRAWHDIAGFPPVRVSVLLEGEEEVGSENLNAFLLANRAELTADVVMISDTAMWDIDTPALTTSLRGMVYAQINLFASERDLHSGIFGGSALNPINALTRILGGLHDQEGRVMLPGFYDGVAEVSDAQAQAWAGLGFDEGAFLGGIGLHTPVGERGLPGLHRLWARPTADINGIWGGYQGDGPKTVIAAEAGAKVSFRLVPGQDPAKIFAALKQFVEHRLPPDARVTFQSFASDPAIEIPVTNRFVAAATAALKDEYGRTPVLIGCGGSIPVVESFATHLGMESVLMGFGLEDDQAHSPDEKFEISCLDRGTLSHARFLNEAAKL